MTHVFLKPVLAAALVATTLAPLAEARDRAMVLQRGAGNSVVFMAPSMAKALDRSALTIVDQGPLKTLNISLDCEVAGTPVEFPDDIRISNPYSFAIAAGTVASYLAPFGNTGTVVLPALEPGHGVYVSNAVPGGITAGSACSASTL